MARPDYKSARENYFALAIEVPGDGRFASRGGEGEGSGTAFPIEPGMNRIYIGLGLLVTLFLFTLWWVAPTYKRAKADAMVDELCARDGGIKVYETVKLPANRFDKFGNIRIPFDPKPGVDYYLKNEIRWIVPYSDEGNISISRRNYQVRRVSDNKVLGEVIWYLRRGGDPISPAHPSSHRCPEDVGVEKKVFIKE